MIGAIAYDMKALNNESIPVNHGQLLHGVCFNLLKDYSSELASYVHDKMSVKPFAIAELDFFDQRQEKNNRLYISAQTMVRWRVCALNDAVLKAFMSVQSGSILVIGRLRFEVVKILADPDLCRYTGLVEPECMLAECLSLPPVSKLTLNFRSVTTFRLDTSDFPWPLPEYVFGSLADKWNTMDMPGDISAAWVREEARKMLPLEWEGRSRRVYLSAKRGTRGFVGRFSYNMKALSDEAKRVMMMLASYGEFSGIGRWTPHGLGQVRIVD